MATMPLPNFSLTYRMHPRLPYAALTRTALVTAPLIAIILVTPIILAGSLPMHFFWVMAPMLTIFVLLAWVINIGLLHIRHWWGSWHWVQVIIATALVFAVAFALFEALRGLLNVEDEQAVLALQSRLMVIRLVNISAVNTIIYVLIRLRYFHEVQAALSADNARLRFSNLETRYQLLKDQINPHFLFNALGTAKSLVRRDSQLAEAYLIRLSDFLRASLDEPQDSIALREELKLVRDYISLQQMRFQEALHYHCNIDPVVAPARLPFFALLTLVENAVKHNHMTPQSPLHIHIERSGDRICVRNNRQPKAFTPSNIPTGLDNLQARCGLLGHGHLLVEADDQEFRVTLTLSPV
jgi:two-component system, LytTR family, sensor kinase